MMPTQTAMQQLELVREAKIFDILPGSLDPRLEASGVLAKDGLFYVIFDNLPHIACIDPELSRAGRVPGGGRIHVFQRGPRDWDRVATIRLPETVQFTDYSGIAVAGERIAVLSQESSALWLGRLAPDGWQVTDAGVSYALPRAAD